ncbi:MAG: hypothetical protein ACPMAG_09955 [Limisphaerales bacterium]
MKRLAILITALIAASSLTLIGADKVVKQNKHQRNYPPEIMEKYDTNKDGVLDKTELQKLRQDIKAGVITRDQLKVNKKKNINTQNQTDSTNQQSDTNK